MYVLNVRLLPLAGRRTHLRRRSACPHGDNHDLWIAPDDPLRMIEGNDGGANVSVRRRTELVAARTTSRRRSSTTSSRTTRFPYRVYGAQQDNTHGRHRQPPRSEARHRPHADWYPTWAAARAATSRPSPGDPDVVYAGCYGGLRSRRYDHRTGQERDVTVWPDNPMGCGRGGDEVPLPVDLPHRVLAARPERRSTPAATASSARRTRARPGRRSARDLTRQRRGEARLVRRTDHQGQHQHRVLRDRLRARRVAAREGRDLGRLRRRARARLARRRQDLDERHAARMPEWSTGQPDRRRRTHQDGTAYSGGQHATSSTDFKPYAWETTDYGKTWRRITGGLPETSFVRRRP